MIEITIKITGENTDNPQVTTETKKIEDYEVIDVDKFKGHFKFSDGVKEWSQWKDTMVTKFLKKYDEMISTKENKMKYGWYRDIHESLPYRLCIMFQGVMLRGKLTTDMTSSITTVKFALRISGRTVFEFSTNDWSAPDDANNRDRLECIFNQAFTRLIGIDYSWNVYDTDVEFVEIWEV